MSDGSLIALEKTSGAEPAVQELGEACVKRSFDVGQVWEWSCWDGRIEQHLLLWVEYSDDQEEQWCTFNLNIGKLWSVSFLNEWHDAWERLS